MHYLTEHIDVRHHVPGIADAIALLRQAALGQTMDIVTHRLCGHCDINEVPLYDQLLAQKMMLELDEERFLKLANRHRVVA